MINTEKNDTIFKDVTFKEIDNDDFFIRASRKLVEYRGLTGYLTELARYKSTDSSVIIRGIYTYPPGKYTQVYQNVILLKYPLKVGTKWIYYDDNKLPFWVEVKTHHKSFTNGYFNFSDVYELEVLYSVNPSETINQFYAEGVGLVYEEIKKTPDFPRNYIKRLYKYEISPQYKEKIIR